MRVTLGLAIVLSVAVGLGRAHAAPPQDPPSLVLARERVEACRGDVHREKMRVRWTDLADEAPPDGAEVVLVRGWFGYGVTRMLLQGGLVEAGTVCASPSWSKPPRATSFVVSRERFVLAWNAMRRILAASDERVGPAPEAMGGGGVMSSHSSVDWIRATVPDGRLPIHRADQPGHTFTGDGVRRWEGLRDQAIVATFAALIPSYQSRGGPALLESWLPRLAAELREATVSLDVERVRRDQALLETCVRVLGAAGDEASEVELRAFRAALSGLDPGEYWVQSLREDLARATVRLRLRLRWSRDEVERAIRSLTRGWWIDQDHSSWLRDSFREKDPAGYAEFLRDEATSAGARADALVEAAASLRELPSDRAVEHVRRLLGRENPYVRLEAALALHDLASDDAGASSAVVALALDRSIACDQPPDRLDRWSRSRALAAALDWGGLGGAALRAHLLAPELDRPQFIAAAQNLLGKTPLALTDDEARAMFGRILAEAPARDVLSAVEHLVVAGDVRSKSRMLAALDRIAQDPDVDGRDLKRSREEVRRLPNPAEGAK